MSGNCVEKQISTKYLRYFFGQKKQNVTDFDQEPL